jgi:hypothetical protein
MQSILHSRNEILSLTLFSHAPQYHICLMEYAERAVFPACTALRGGPLAGGGRGAGAGGGPVETVVYLVDLEGFGHRHLGGETKGMLQASGAG